uniref:Uncharacterized protein n=1 Tax=Anguilla anguilla TaxID=7936 RepID=A0A0E9QY33_ANGAN
MFEKMSPL